MTFLSISPLMGEKPQMMVSLESGLPTKGQRGAVLSSPCDREGSETSAPTGANSPVRTWTGLSLKGPPHPGVGHTVPRVAIRGTTRAQSCAWQSGFAGGQVPAGLWDGAAWVSALETLWLC